MWAYVFALIPAPPGLPLLGHVLQFPFGPAHTLPTWSNRCFKQLGTPRIFRANFAGTIWLFVRDVHFIQSTLLSRKDAFPRKKENELLNALTASDSTTKFSIAVTSITPYVKAVRKLYMAAFSTRNLIRQTPKMRAVLSNLITVINNKIPLGPIDVQDLCIKMTLDMIGKVAFECDLGGLDNNQNLTSLIVNASHIGFDRFFNPLKKAYCFLFPQSAAAKYQRSQLGALKAEWEKLTKNILERDDPPDGEQPIWYALKTLKDPETGEAIEHATLLSEVASVAIAGMDATGHQLAWILALLATNPRVTERLIDELTEHGLHGAESRPLEFEDLSKLEYLLAVVKEGMRCAHVILVTSPRIVPHDMTILGYRVPKGTVVVSPGNQGYSTEADWSDPDVFRPERWLSDEDMSQKYYFPFSVGSRACVGSRFALFEMRFCIVEIVKQYKISLVGTYEGLKTTARCGVVIEASDGIWLDFTPRK